MQVVATSKDTQNSDRVDEARSPVELCFELDALPADSESESSSNESNWSETSEPSCTLSDLEEQYVMYGNGDVETNAEQGEDENVQGVSGEETVEDSGRLLLAAERGHVEVVRSLLMQSADSIVDALDANQNTPLHLAAAFGHKDVVDLLLSNNSKVDCRNADDHTPLHLASENGHIETVEALIGHGAAINACNRHNKTPLHLAAKMGRTSIVVILLDNRATVDVRQPVETPFDLAAMNGHAEVVDVLLRRHVSKFKGFLSESSPLHVAIERKHTKVAEVILKHRGRTSKKISKDGNEPQDNVGNLVETRNTKPVVLKKSDNRLVSAEIVWTETSIPLEIMRDSDGYNALELAVRSIQPKIVKMLLKRDQCVYSEKHLAVSFRYLTKTLVPNSLGRPDAFECKSIREIAEVLVNSDRFNVNHQGMTLDTPLHDIVEMCLICFNGFLTNNSSEQLWHIQTLHDIISLLLKKGADFNIKNCKGETALIISSQYGCLHTVQTLLDWQHKTGMKLDLDARDQFGATALIKAAEMHHVSVMQLLLKNKASVNLHDYYGFTALHAAVYEPNRNWFDLHFFCKGLRKRKLDKNDNLEISQSSMPTSGPESMVPYKAIDRLKKIIRHDEKRIRFKEEMVKLLLGIDETNVNAIDFKGNTPLDLAVESSRRISSETFKELENRDAIQNLLEPKDEALVDMARIDKRGRNPYHRLMISHVSNYAIEGMKVAKTELTHERFGLMVCGILLKKENSRNFAALADDKGRTPLHYARDGDLVRVLLELGCGVNATDTYGKTPLHYAEENHQYEFLLNHGANENIKDVYGYTPRDLKQLRDMVTIREDNSENLPIRMNELYLPRAFNINHLAELKKQTLPTTIKICSQSPRLPESSEEAVWKIWIENDFIRLNKRVSHLKAPMQQFMERLAHSIKEKDSRFECQPMLVGSADEETKVILSADFDYNFKLTKFDQLCEVIPHPLGPAGYFELRRKSYDDVKSQNDEVFGCFFNSDQCLLTREVNSRFQLILEEVLSNANFWKDEHLFEWNITDEKKTGKPAGLCKTVRLRMLRPIDDGEGDLLFVNISVDIVACIYVGDWCPRDPLPVGISSALKGDGCTLVFDRPSFDPSIPRGWRKRSVFENKIQDGFHFSETFARISFAPVESRIIRESSLLMKSAYIVCKMRLYRQPKTTYQLKTCFLFCLEAVNTRNLSDARNKVEFTRMELAFCVERLMFCFMEFSRHDVFPCYLMPSFRQLVTQLHYDNTDLQSSKADKNNEYSNFRIPCNFSKAYDLYLDICPDNTAVDITIDQGNYDLVEGSLKANHDPTWKQFDRKEFIRKLTSRSLDKQCNSSTIM